MAQQSRKWMKLDNAAKIYPASMSKRWMAMFRFSAYLYEDVDPAILQRALNRTLPRFPSFAQRLRHGFFWNYLEQVDSELKVQKDVGNPCAPMNLKENNGYMLRVRYHEKRVAVEFFHVLTDGSGGLIFTKTLLAEYVTLKYGEVVPRGKDLFDVDQSPEKSETEDGFLRFARDMGRSRNEPSSYLIPGTETENFMHITTGLIGADAMRELAKRYGATVTELVTSVLILSIEGVQSRQKPNRKKHKPVKICVPVNLRRYYDTNTVRNFSSYINPGIEPKYGRYTLEETVKRVHGVLAGEMDEKLLNAKFSTNVMSERNIILRLVPMFIKRHFMNAAFILKGDRQTSSVVSNLGNVTLPDELARHIERFDLMLGPMKRNRVACACMSYNGTLTINLTRKIIEPHVERSFYRALVKLGLHVQIESNQRWT